MPFFCSHLFQFLGPCDGIGSSQIIWENLRILRSADSKSLFHLQLSPLPCNRAYSQVLGISTGTALEAIILPDRATENKSEKTGKSSLPLWHSLLTLGVLSSLSLDTRIFVTRVQDVVSELYKFCKFMLPWERDKGLTQVSLSAMKRVEVEGFSKLLWCF